jgi:hypothetical protein
MRLNQGFYHGSPFRDGRKTYGAKGNTIPEITPGRPFFVTNDLPYAIKFARGGLVSEVKVLTERVIDLHDLEVVDRLLAVYNADPKILDGEGAWDAGTEGEIIDSCYRLLDSPAVMSMLIDEGYEAVFIPEDIELRVTSYAILNPQVVEFQGVVSVRVPRHHPTDDLGR